MSEKKVSPRRLCGAEAVRRESRNTMMAPQADTSYRDRVDRMAAAILVGLMYRWKEPGYTDKFACCEAADLAAYCVDAIDEMLKEREAGDVQS